MTLLSAARASGMALIVLAGVFGAVGESSAQASPEPPGTAQAGDGLSPQTQAPKALPGLGKPSAAVERPAASDGFWAWIERTQRQINGQLSAAIRDLKSQGSFAAAGLLALLGFGYGVLHAAGPGHGKAVISSYVLANEKTMWRGVKLSFLAAFIQAMSAITIVGVLYVLLKTTSMQMRIAEAWIETLSWALVAGIGAWLLYRQFEKLMPARAPIAATKHHHDHDHAADGSCIHNHGHDHKHAHAPAEVAGPSKGHAASAVHDHSADVHCAHCGHAHMPDPSQLEGELGWRKSLAIAFSVGIRPCTGAIFVLGFALSQGMLWAGIFATFAMALGTAITVSTLAVLAVGSRDLAQRMAGSDSRWGQRIELGVGLAGSAAVFLMGAVFFVASLDGPGPL